MRVVDRKKVLPEVTIGLNKEETTTLASILNKSELEKELSIELADNKILFGRIDRIDSNNSNEKLIIDYKTGRSANQESVDTAEDVQLITYALLDDDVDNVFYLQLDDNKGGVKPAASLSGDGSMLITAFPPAISNGNVMPVGAFIR